MIKNILLVAFGGSIGSVLRYLISLQFQSKVDSNFPIYTFLVNLLGCLIIGLIAGYSTRNNWFDNGIYLLFATGFCGGFTTFSALGLESLKLLQNGQYTTVITYLASSLGLGVLLTFIGWSLAK